MKEIDSYEKKVLQLVYFPETYAAIVEEANISEFIVGDCIRSLSHKKMLFAMKKDPVTGKFSILYIFDKDNLQNYYYQITGLGMEALEIF